MYILSGKGSVAGVDFSATVLRMCQQKGVLWDNDLPEYTIDFATQIPSVSKSIREGFSESVVKEFNVKLKQAEHFHSEYIILCLTAHKLISQLQTRMKCLDLWEHINLTVATIQEPIAFLGTLESLPSRHNHFITLSNHTDLIGDLITSVKRGYAQLGENYAAHPKNLLRKIVDEFQYLGVRKFFLACTDLQACKQELVGLGIPEKNIFSVIDIAAKTVIERAGKAYGMEFLDAVSDARTHMRYKYVSGSDAPQTDKKTHNLEVLISRIQPRNTKGVSIIDIGGSSTGHSVRLAKQLTDKHRHITLLDISSASLSAAKLMHDTEDNIETEYINESIENYHPRISFDAVLCVGVLLYISSDATFATVVKKIASFIKPNGILITRDCLHDKKNKEYMAFGGVIRNRAIYEEIFVNVNLTPIDSIEFVIKEPINRNIVTTVWQKS